MFISWLNELASDMITKRKIQKRVKSIDSIRKMLNPKLDFYQKNE
jgi:hypothetical protein